MTAKIPVSVLGATGTVGQKFVRLLADHPWFCASQFHAEFKSRPTRPHPLFRHFVAAAVAFGWERAGRQLATEPATA